MSEWLEAPHQSMRVLDREDIGSHIHKIRLGTDSGPVLSYPIGSYVQPMVGGCVPRAYSVVEDNGNGCTIMVSSSGQGVGARFFQHIQKGDSVTVYGPFDDFRYRYRTGRPKIFLATGTGVAPFIRMTAEAIAENVPVLLGLGVPHEVDIPYRGYFTRLAKEHDNFDFMPALSSPHPEWKGARGYITDQFRGYEKYLRMSDIYVCGIPPMVAGVSGLLERAHVPKDQIFIQKFG